MFQRWNSGAVSFGIQESKTMSSRAKEVQCDANDDSENILRVTKGGVRRIAACVVFLNICFRPQVIKRK